VEPHAEKESAPEAEGSAGSTLATWVQLDGSFHAWFEERGPQGCLMNMVDDATGTTCSRLGEQETIWAAVGVLRSWIAKYGVPRALYTDWKNVYKREPTERERTARKGAHDAIWAHVRAVGDSHYRRQFSTSERARGAQQRSTSRSPGEETATPRDSRATKPRMSIWKRNILRSTTSVLHREAARAENYHVRAPSAAKLREVFPVRDGTMDQQRLGWCSTGGIFCNSNRRINAMGRHKPRP